MLNVNGYGTRLRPLSLVEGEFAELVAGCIEDTPKRAAISRPQCGGALSLNLAIARTHLNVTARLVDKSTIVRPSKGIDRRSAVRHVRLVMPRDGRKRAAKRGAYKRSAARLLTMPTFMPTLAHSGARPSTPPRVQLTRNSLTRLVEAVSRQAVPR